MPGGSRDLSRCIFTTVCVIRPASERRAAPWLRLTTPDAIAASWSVMARSRRSETAIGSLSADTTLTALRSPVRAGVKLVSRAHRYCLLVLHEAGGCHGSSMH